VTEQVERGHQAGQVPRHFGVDARAHDPPRMPVHVEEPFGIARLPTHEGAVLCSPFMTVEVCGVACVDETTNVATITGLSSFSRWTISRSRLISLTIQPAERAASSLFIPLRWALRRAAVVCDAIPMKARSWLTLFAWRAE
jgi:hypothetical protein